MSNENLESIKSEILDINPSLPIFFTRMTPAHLFEVGSAHSEVPLTAVSNAIVLCISAIGSPTAFVEVVKKVKYFNTR